MPVYLVTREEADKQHSLMHYRTPGSKNGIRRYQDKNGDYTAAGYQHYKEMYGWGERKAARNVESKGQNPSGTSNAQNARLSSSSQTSSRQNYVNQQSRLSADSIRRLEETSKMGYLNPLNEERNKGLTKERDRISKMYTDEYWKKVKTGMPENDPSDAGRELWDKYKDAYAIATLKDSGMPVTKENVKIVQEIFEKYDSHYKYGLDYESEERQKIDEAWGSRYSNKFNNSLDAAVEEAVDAVAEAEAERIVDSNRFVEGSKAFKENIEFEKKFEKFDKLSKAEQNKIGNEVVKRINEDHGKINTKESDLSDLDNEKMQDIKYEFGKYSSWLYDRIHEKSGNWNTGESVSPAHKAAMKALNAGYEKSIDREEEIKKQINYQSVPYNLKRNTSILGAIKAAKQEKVREQEYQRLQQALKNDTLYQALAANNHKNERALVEAVLRDIGLSNTPENRAMIDWYVFND